MGRSGYNLILLSCFCVGHVCISAWDISFTYGKCNIYYNIKSDQMKPNIHTFCIHFQYNQVKVEGRETYVRYLFNTNMPRDSEAITSHLSS